MAMDPRWYQREAVDLTIEAVRASYVMDPETNVPKRFNPLICLPTGTGKSLVIAGLVWCMFQLYPTTRVIMGTHVKELVKQNAAQLRKLWPLAPIGINSAGLGQRSTDDPIIYGGIKSMVAQLDDFGVTAFGFRDFLFIDEAHLVSPNSDTQYVAFILELMAKNPWLRIIGLSATPYRMGLGLLTNGQIFTDITYNMCNIEGFARLLADGFISPVYARPTEQKLDLSGVSLSYSNGDFQQGALEEKIDNFETNYGALAETVKYGWNRRSWMIFASGIKHAENIANMLNTYFGVNAVAVHSKRGDKFNDAAIEAFKSGQVRCIVNKDMLTTGFDHPYIDLIAMLRPTMSTGLWVQMVGRGTRPAPGKNGCLVLDFAGNTPRLGPIDDPVIPRPKNDGPPGDAPIRICHEDWGGCGFYNRASAKFCSQCGHEFPPGDGPELYTTAGTEALMAGIDSLPINEYFKVNRSVLVPHVSKASGRKTIKVAYYCQDMKTFYEYITVEPKIEKDGTIKNDFAQKKGRDWYRQRTGEEPPETNEEVLMNLYKLRTPDRVFVWMNKKPSPEIRSYEF